MSKTRDLRSVPGVDGYLKSINAQVTGPLSISVSKRVIGDDGARRYRFVHNVLVFDKEDGTVSCKFAGKGERLLPTEKQQKAITDGWKTYEFPTYETLPCENMEVFHGMLIEEQRVALASGNLFIIKSQDGTEVLMMQQRCDDEKHTEKWYVPWTYWKYPGESVGEWKRMDPPGKKPLYGLEDMEPGSIVFLHEGAKCARSCANLEMEHPWYDKLDPGKFAHIGWIGGAPNWMHTDWSPLQNPATRPAKVIIVADNDKAGMKAALEIPRHIYCATDKMSFDVSFKIEGKREVGRFPPSFDLADKFPEDFWEDGRYIGPTFDECVEDATFLTYTKFDSDGKPYHILREHAEDLFVHVSSINAWAHRNLRGRFGLNGLVDNANLTATLRSRYDGSSRQIVDLLLKTQASPVMGVSYNPDMYSERSPISLGGKGSAFYGQRCFNMYTPTDVVRRKYDSRGIRIWLEYLEYMFPDEREREWAIRWMCTLVANPRRKMLWGMMLYTKNQGIGKTTLGNVLRSLVGRHNSCVLVGSNINRFNGLLMNKRLAVIEEVIKSERKLSTYEWAKSKITDEGLNIERKGKDQVTVENFCHFVATTNYRTAHMVPEKDRRWFYPRLPERRWQDGKYGELNQWLDSGGIGMVYGWMCDQYAGGMEVADGSHAPMTDLKEEIIEESMTVEVKYGMRIAELLDKTKGPWAISRSTIEKIVQMKARTERTYMGKVDVEQIKDECLKANGAIELRYAPTKGKRYGRPWRNLRTKDRYLCNDAFRRQFFGKSENKKELLKQYELRTESFLDWDSMTNTYVFRDPEWEEKCSANELFGQGKGNLSVVSGDG